ncbi:hypothetical protein TNCT_467111 [Trichonephila clavata]|uniref:Uncharacterized protein n=1 Tax=Trichonephila clavata TaxID=2740835 RepID=A0A8X6G8L0_TRICU|nr:hypothetical protein TNCT_467111 [Trichonephila clavata]
MQRVFSQPLNIKKPELQSIEAIIKDEVDRSLATITSQPITASQQFFSSAQRPTLKDPQTTNNIRRKITNNCATASIQSTAKD